jgi:Methyltransferase domain
MSDELIRNQSQPRLRGFEKALRGSSGHKSRLHSLRGEFIPLSAWRWLPSALLTRLGVRFGDPGPWIVPAATAWLARAVQPSWEVFEFGSGYSTAWFALRVGSVVSLEDDPVWLSKTSDCLRQRGVTNCSLLQSPLSDFSARIDDWPDSTFDLVVVDSMETETVSRLDCIKAARQKVKPGRYLLLDDSDNPSLWSASDILSSWHVQRFVGMKDFPFAVFETSIFTRPSVS